MLPVSVHFEASFLISSDDNMLSNRTYLHANYNIHILILSVLHTHLVCIEVAGVFSGEYYTLLVAYFHSHKLFLHRRDTGKCIYRPLILFFLRSVNLFNVYNNIYFYFKLFCWGIIPKLRVYLVIIWALCSRKGGNSKKNQIYVYMPKMFQMLKFIQI